MKFSLENGRKYLQSKNLSFTLTIPAYYIADSECSDYKIKNCRSSTFRLVTSVLLAEYSYHTWITVYMYFY